MNNMTKETKKKIRAGCDRFEDAMKAVESAEMNLDKVIRPTLRSCKETEDYMELIDILPPRFKGVRRIYEEVNRKHP